MSNKLKQDVLSKIHDNKVEQKSRAHFLSRRYLLWGSLIALILILIANISVAHYLIINADWQYYRTAYPSLLPFLLKSIPLLWLILIATVGTGAFFIFRQTDTGHRHRTISIVALIIVIALPLGLIANRAQVGSQIDRFSNDHIPGYHQLIHRPRQAIWLAPAEGRLAGQVIEIISPTEFRLRDFAEQEWLIKKTPSDRRWPGPDLTDYTIETNLRLFGQQIDAQTFAAEHIAPWELPGRRPIMPKPNFSEKNLPPQP